MKIQYIAWLLSAFVAAFGATTHSVNAQNMPKEKAFASSAACPRRPSPVSSAISGNIRGCSGLGQQPARQRQHHLLRLPQGRQPIRMSARNILKQYERVGQPYGTSEYKVPVAAVVTPKDCSRCHPDEAKQYSRSKHANTMEIIWKIDPWLNKGMNSDFERASGCLPLPRHGPENEGRQSWTRSWPNVGVGRINLDGSKGSCTSCHTRHRFR
jgi:hydroxylamine dehydrogenase